MFYHSFSPEFYFAEGEPYDRPDLALNAKGQPVSLYSAILQALEKNDFYLSALDYLSTDVQFAPMKDTLALELLTIARATDLVTDISRPVNVWIDPKGNLTVKVFE